MSCVREAADRRARVGRECCARRFVTNIPVEMTYDSPVKLDQLAESYRRDGAALVRGLLDEAQVDLLCLGIEANLASPSSRALVASREEDPGRFFEDFCTWQNNEAYRELIEDARLAQVARHLMESQTVRLFHDHVLVKEPGTVQRTPWHQDQPYYNVDGHQNVSFWIPADPVAAENSLELVTGTHLGPWLMPRTFLDREARWFPEGELAEVPDIDANRQDYEILQWELEPGDAVAFHMLTLHAAPGAALDARRRVLSIRLLGDDARHAPRRWRTSPEFPGLADELPPGAPMEHPLFPLL